MWGFDPIKEFISWSLVQQSWIVTQDIPSWIKTLLMVTYTVALSRSCMITVREVNLSTQSHRPIASHLENASPQQQLFYGVVVMFRGGIPHSMGELARTPLACRLEAG